MRVLGMKTENVGGIVDGYTVFPEGPIMALAGSNGTGKSKFLACILAPWSGFIPPADYGEKSRVEIYMQFTAQERCTLKEYSEASGWGNQEFPKNASVILEHHPTAGFMRSSDPDLFALRNGFQSAELVRAQPSLDVVYLPAERRLHAAGSNNIDLSQLSELMALQKVAEPRNAVHNYGQLDDHEFESFARALCVAATLPDEPGQHSDAANAHQKWEEFQRIVNTIIGPKTLLPLTRQNPDQLRIETPSGAVHGVQDLSSGERQALIVISRVFRGGPGHSLIMIDEPDAYLHPTLSQRLVQAIREGVPEDGQLIVATHSPGILDALPPSSIVRMSHDGPPRLISDEGDRLELYRTAGFRASSLTQADLLLLVEGPNDVPLLKLQFPELNRASLIASGGRDRVFREVSQLSPYDLPVIGVVDRDIDAPPVPESISSRIIVWPTGDIEGVYLSDDSALEVMIDKRLTKPSMRNVAQLREMLNELTETQKENVIAEIAQRRLRHGAEFVWPSPKGERPIQRLQEMVEDIKKLSAVDVSNAIDEATARWESFSIEDRWSTVRAKSICNQFANRASEMRSGQALLEAIARESPNLHGFARFRAFIGAELARKPENDSYTM